MYSSPLCFFPPVYALLELTWDPPLPTLGYFLLCLRSKASTTTQFVVVPPLCGFSFPHSLSNPRFSPPSPLLRVSLPRLIMPSHSAEYLPPYPLRPLFPSSLSFPLLLPLLSNRLCCNREVVFSLVEWMTSHVLFSFSDSVIFLSPVDVWFRRLWRVSVLFEDGVHPSWLVNLSLYCFLSPTHRNHFPLSPLIFGQRLVISFWI